MQNGGSASAGYTADAYRSASSLRLAAGAQRSGRGHAGSYWKVTTTLPLACPSPRYRSASGTWLSGKRRSITVVIFPAWPSSMMGSRCLDTEPDSQHSYLLAPGSSDQRPDQQDLQARGHRPANTQVTSSGHQRAPVSECRPVGGQVEDQVVAASGPGEVLPRVVDDAAGAERAHELQLLCVVNPGDLGPGQLGQLHGVHARATAAAVDQDLLPGLNLSLVPDALPGDGSRLRQGRGLLVSQASRHRRQRGLRHADVLREPTHMTEDVAEHVIARPEHGRAPARRRDSPRDV